MAARYDPDTIEGRAELARHVIRRTRTTVEERYGLLAVVVWGEASHDVAGAIMQMDPDELVERLRGRRQRRRGVRRYGEQGDRRNAEIRRRAAAGELQAALAAEYGVSRARISQIVSGAAA